MAIVFPASPSVNDTFTAGSITYKWDGDKWIGLGVTPADRLIEGSNSLEINASNQLVWTGDDIIQSSANKSFKSNSTSSGDYVRMYAGGGTAQWDIYGNGELLRMGDNSSSATARIQFDNPTFHRSTATTTGVAALTAKQEVNNGGYLIYEGLNSSDTSVFSVTHNGRLRITENLFMGTTDGISALPGIQMYLGGGDPSLVGCKADNNPGQYVTLLKLAGYSQSGTNFRENGAILFETDAANNVGSASGRIIFRTESQNETNGPTTRMEIASTGRFAHIGGHGAAANISDTTYYRINGGASISQSSSRTFTITGLTSGWMTIRGGGYSNAGQSQFACAYQLGGYMTATSSYDVVTLQQWTNGATISITKNASSFQITITNNSANYALSAAFTIESSSYGLAISAS